MTPEPPAPPHNPLRATSRISVSASFWLGVALPTLLLVLFILFLVFATGSGRETAPVVALVLSFIAIPATMLANCWVLFVNWRSRGLLFAAGLLLPLYVGCGMAIYVHGSLYGENAGLTMLTPFFAIGETVGRQPVAWFALWTAGMAASILGARTLAIRR